MTNDFIDLKCCGLHLSTAAKKYIFNKFRSVLKEAPLGSTYNFILSKRGLSFKGVVTLTSSDRKYVAVAVGDTLDEVLRKLITQIKKKFEKIKSSRLYRHNRYYKNNNFQLSA